MNETLSMNQANQLMRAVDEELQTAARNIEKDSNQFLYDLSKIWEDKNATEFAGKYNTAIKDVISTLSKNDNTIIETIGDIATYYAKQGGMSERPNVLIKVMQANIDYQVVKENFADSENGDDFGFKNVNEGASQVMDTYNQYKSKMKQTASQLADRMNGINAFGNSTISMQLTKSAGNIVEILTNALETIGRGIEEGVSETANAYIAAGIAASDVIKGLIGEKEIEKITPEIIHQKMYGAPSGGIADKIITIPDGIGDIGGPQKVYGAPSSGIEGTK